MGDAGTALMGIGRGSGDVTLTRTSLSRAVLCCALYLCAVLSFKDSTVYPVLTVGLSKSLRVPLLTDTISTKPSIPHTGKSRAQEAAAAAISSPLLDFPIEKVASTPRHVLSYAVTRIARIMINPMLTIQHLILFLPLPGKRSGLQHRRWQRSNPPRGKCGTGYAVVPHLKTTHFEDLRIFFMEMKLKSRNSL